MCLDTISKRKPAKTGFGWKVFIRHANPDFVVSSCIYKRYPVGAWLEAEKVEVSTEFGSATYITGFHIFKTLKAARAYKSWFPQEAIRRVQYRRARLSGTGSSWPSGSGSDRQVIADSMKILEEVK